MDNTDKMLKLLNSKQVYSRASHTLVEFIRDLRVVTLNETGEKKAYSDGVNLEDMLANVAADMEYMYVRYKSGYKMNYQDFAVSNGMFKDFDKYYNNVSDKLADREEI